MTWSQNSGCKVIGTLVSVKRLQVNEITGGRGGGGGGGWGTDKKDIEREKGKGWNPRNMQSL